MPIFLVKNFDYKFLSVLSMKFKFIFYKYCNVTYYKQIKKGRLPNKFKGKLLYGFY